MRIEFVLQGTDLLIFLVEFNRDGCRGGPECYTKDWDEYGRDVVDVVLVVDIVDVFGNCGAREEEYDCEL